MAGGIDWFRWHHGSVTDPKFGVVAKKAGVRVSDVLAVWVFVLEAASADADRGTIGQIDFEAVELLLGLEEGQCGRILDAMTQRGLIEGSRIASWDKRQPKRERDTDNSVDRTRAYRERLKQQGDAVQNHVTPCDATERQKNARGEESREEKKTPTTVGVGPSKRPAKRCPEGFHPSPEMLAWAEGEFPAVDLAAATAKFRDHTFSTARSDWPATWRNWIRTEAEFKASRAPPADAIKTTVPAKPGRDPALLRLEEDAARAKPMTPEIRQALQEAAGRMRA